MDNSIWGPRFLLVSTAAMLVACASGVKKADIPGNANPSDQISELETQINQERSQQVDLLSKDDFEHAERYLDKAKKDLASDSKQAKILDDVATGKGYAAHAQEDADNRRPRIAGVLAARGNAETAGATNMPETKDEMSRLDGEISSHATKLETMDPGDIAKLENGYLDLESKAIHKKYLGDAKAMIIGAKNNKAEKYAPKALHQAEVDYSAADGTIRDNLHAPDAFKKQVDQANYSAQVLTATLANTQGGKVDEATAAGIVQRDLQIAQMKGDINSKDAQASGLQSKIDQQNGELQRNGKAISIQKSIDEARSEFSPEEAEVFQQGQKLFIRIKDLNFPSGRAELPAAALPILAKVRKVASGLSPREILVEGHTDSVGSKKLNMKLSQERADAVAEYLKDGLGSVAVNSVGEGFDHPLAENKTAEGRATNRRVDVLITPSFE